MYLSGTFFLDWELSDWVEGGNLPSWSKKQRAFLSAALSVSLNQLYMEETTFCQKADNFAYFFHLWIL